MTITLRPSTHRTLKQYKTIYSEGRKIGWVALNESTGRWQGSLNLGTTPLGFNSEIAALIAPKVARLIANKKASTAKLDEAGFLKSMGDRVKNGISDFAADTKDRVAYGLGDKGRQGSIDLRLATKTLNQQWATYARRKHAAGDPNILERPTIANLVAFLRLQYGIKVDPEELNHALNGTKPAPEPDAAPEKSAAQQATESRLANMVRKALAEAGIEDKQLPDDDAEPEQEQRVTAAQVTFNPRTAFVKVADLLMDAGLLSVSRDGQTTSGSLHGGDEGKGTDPADLPTVSAEEGAKIASKVTKSGLHLDMVKLSSQLGAKGVSARQIEWIRTDITDAERMKAAVMTTGNDSRKVGSMSAAELVTNVALAVVTALTKQELKGTNITSLGSTVDVVKFMEVVEQWGVTDEQIEALRGSVKDAAQLQELLIRGKNSAIMPVFAVVNAFAHSLVSVQK